MSGEKTEKPTAKKRKEARKEGQFPRTADFGAWVGVLAASFILPHAIGSAMDNTSALFVEASTLIEDPEPAQALSLLSEAAKLLVTIVAPLCLVLLAVAVLSHAAQGGIPVATKKFKPDFKHLNPISGIKRLFGPQGAWEGIKTLLKVGVLAFVVWHAMRGIHPLLARGSSMPLSTVLDAVGDTVITLMRQAAMAGLVLAAADYAVVRHRIEKGMRMSKQDIKDEYKQAEGDPHVKGQIRSRQMAMSRNRMMADAANADVVLVNPTHVAVALRYDPATGGAPRVVAKGAGALAAKIRAIADENRIPMVQDVPLARTLYKAVDVGGEVPPDLYNAIARVLAFVLSLKARGSAAGMHRVPVH
ncbi:EscU/YscU/HrcU family type III secretion system export apparatus switch protein [Motilibacter aurantiacus]|uniref:EscU/YscU/HrcU family type III secretion system export apparatus switch protein n=1 Tax=Motilibacter aurantiacus TaxID=2714955 RepID=UPI0014088238|nr:EscU/YscU/HrcU family type III secretion system export apparatus switch protein [Motilibacter aurantiacus]NHC47116.1 EscU/YscU/HrcU family type III secretion system export apparatus switch protein [Motilibacter aurantiacus]